MTICRGIAGGGKSREESPASRLRAGRYSELHVCKKIIPMSLRRKIKIQVQKVYSKDIKYVVGMPLAPYLCIIKS